MDALLLLVFTLDSLSEYDMEAVSERLVIHGLFNSQFSPMFPRKV